MSSSAQSPRPNNSARGGLSRREVMKRAGATTLALGALASGGTAVAPQYSPVGRAKAHPALLVAGAIGIGYVAGVAHERYASADVDEIEDSLAFEDHVRVYNRAREIYEIESELLLNSIRRDADGLRNRAREQAIIDIYEVVVEGGSRSEAEDVAQDAIDETFTPPITDLLTHWNSIINGVATTAHNLDVLYAQEGLSREVDHVDLEEDYTVFNGDAYSLNTAGRSGSSSTRSWTDLWGIYSSTDNHEYLGIIEPDPEDYDLDGPDYDPFEADGYDEVSGVQYLMSEDDWRDTRDAIYDAHQAVSDEIEALVDTHFEGVEAGDLSLQDMLSPAAMTESIAAADTWGELALYFYQLGLSEAEAPAIVEVHSGDLDGEHEGSIELRGLIGWTVPSSVSDLELPMGTEINPNAYPGEFRMAAEWDIDGETEADMISLNSPFTIVAADTADPEFLQFDTREVVTSDTNPDDARQILEDHREVERVARERTVEVVEGGPLLGGWQNPLTDEQTQWAGLGIIGLVVLTVISVVTDLLPGRRR